MAGETTITLVGNLTADPELRFTPAGVAVAGFTVASTNRIFNKQTNEWADGDTLFIRCSAWRQLAENCAATLTKGTRVVVVGALKVRDYERQDGTKGTSVEMTVDEIGPSLRNATAQVQKVQRSGNGGQQGGQPQQTTQQRPQQQPQDDPWGGQPAQQQARPQQDDPWGNGSSEPPF